MTNTRFTSDAEQYAGCYGLRLLAWDYPGKGNLRERIELSGLYPITCLYSLTRKEKETLLADNIVLCRELIENPELLAAINKAIADMQADGTYQQISEKWFGTDIR